MQRARPWRLRSSPGERRRPICGGGRRIGEALNSGCRASCRRRCSDARAARQAGSDDQRVAAVTADVDGSRDRWAVDADCRRWGRRCEQNPRQREVAAAAAIGQQPVVPDLCAPLKNVEHWADQPGRRPDSSADLSTLLTGVVASSTVRRGRRAHAASRWERGCRGTPATGPGASSRDPTARSASWCSDLRGPTIG